MMYYIPRLKPNGLLYNLKKNLIKTIYKKL